MSKILNDILNDNPGQHTSSGNLTPFPCRHVRRFQVPTSKKEMSF